MAVAVVVENYEGKLKEVSFVPISVEHCQASVAKLEERVSVHPPGWDKDD